MSKYIDADKLYKKMLDLQGTKREKYLDIDEVRKIIKNETSRIGEMSEKQTDRVSKSVVEQIKWERDIAIEQLEDLGYELGEKPRTDGDLISRTDLLKDIANLKKSPWFNDGKYNRDLFRRNSYVAREEAVEIVEDLCIKKLSSAKKTEIIRCKECKWFGEIGCAILIVDDTDKPTENDFCSFAERKEQTEQNVGMCQQNVGEKSEKQTDGDLISRQAVSKYVSKMINNRTYPEERQILEDFIEWLENIPSAEKTTINLEKTTITDGDLISREIEKADFLMAKVKDFERTAIMVKYNTETIDSFIDYIRGVIVNAEKYHFVIGEKRKCALREKFKLPSAENTAEWRIVGKTTLHYECSKCGGAGDKWDKFCKNCGAKMKGVE